MSDAGFVLDGAIRDWVLIPIVVVMFLVSLFRHYVTKTFSAASPETPVAQSDRTGLDAMLAASYAETVRRKRAAAAASSSSSSSSAVAKKGSGALVVGAQSAQEAVLVAAENPETSGGAKKKTELKVVRRNALLLRSRRLRGCSNLIPSAHWEARRTLLADDAKGLLSLELPTQAELGMQGAMQGNPMSDPTMMGDMLKQNVAMMLPQMLLFGWVSWFFSGFVVMQLPFNWLTPAFKPMLQRGLVSLAALDTSFVSSMSWYVLVMTGLRALTTIALGEASLADDAAMMQQQVGGQAAAGPAGQPPPDIQKLYKDEKDFVNLVPQQRWALAPADIRLLGLKAE